MAPADAQPRDTSEEVASATWIAGTRRVGEHLEVRDRWQGLFGANAWLTTVLVAGATGSALASVEAGGSDRLGLGLVSLALVLLLLVTVLRFHPVVRFGPETIEWRNRFGLKAIPTSSVEGLGLETANVRSWVPVVVAFTDRKLFKQRAKFLATFSYRRRVAEVVAAQVQRWADEQAIPADLRPASMVWRFNEPKPEPE